MRSGDVRLRQLADAVEIDDDEKAVDPSGAEIMFQGKANPDEPRENLTKEEAEKRNATFPAANATQGTQNPPEYIKAEALPSKDVTEENALDPVTGPILANPEPAKPGTEDEHDLTALATDPDIAETVEEAPKTGEKVAAARPTTEEVEEVAEILPDRPDAEKAPQKTEVEGGDPGVEVDTETSVAKKTSEA